MPGADGQLESFVTLLLAEQAPALAAAHDELYPMRVDEGIPLSLTLLYPFVPAASLGEADASALREFFASRSPFSFEIARVAQWEGGGAVYGVPEPDEELRATMRALWSRYPEYPPYGVPDSDPPPHARSRWTEATSPTPSAPGWSSGSSRSCRHASRSARRR